MRILQVNKFYFPQGGTERVLFDLEAGLRAKGHEVAAFAQADARNLPSEYSAYFAPPRDYDSRDGVGVSLAKAASIIHDRRAAAALEGLLGQFRPDVAHLHNIYHQLSPSILGVLREHRIPTLMTLHDYKLACPVYTLFRDGKPCEECVGRRIAWPVAHHRCSRDSRAESLLLAVESSIHRIGSAYEKGVDLFACPSQFMRTLMERQGLAAGRLRHIPNAPRELGEMASASHRAERPTVFYAGRLSEEKGIDLLVDAARGEARVELRIAGRGPAEASLRSRAEDLEQVHFLGFLDPTQLAAERARAWACASPSRWYENAPMGVLEAMAAGRPVLASDRGGHPEMIRDGQEGLLISASGPGPWRDAFTRLVTGTEEFATMGEAAAKRVRSDFSFESTLQAYVGLYDELRSGRSNP